MWGVMFVILFVFPSNNFSRGRMYCSRILTCKYIKQCIRYRALRHIGAPIYCTAPVCQFVTHIYCIDPVYHSYILYSACTVGLQRKYPNHGTRCSCIIMYWLIGQIIATIDLL